MENDEWDNTSMVNSHASHGGSTQPLLAHLAWKEMAERREEDRIEVCLDAVWDGTMGKYSARITDLSEGGCYIDSLCEAYVGEVIQFNMQLPTGEWLELSGEIAHHVPQIGFGVRFVNLSDSNRQKLISILSGPSGPREDLSPGKTS